MPAAISEFSVSPATWLNTGTRQSSVVAGDEPQQPVGVRQRGVDALVAGQDGAEVEVALLDEAVAGRVLGDHEDVSGRRGRDDAVLVVEVEVPAAGEVLEDVGVALQA